MTLDELATIYTVPWYPELPEHWPEMPGAAVLVVLDVAVCSRVLLARSLSVHHFMETLVGCTGRPEEQCRKALWLAVRLGLLRTSLALTTARVGLA